jgi:hypothetical protein
MTSATFDPYRKSKAGALFLQGEVAKCELAERGTSSGVVEHCGVLLAIEPT